MSEKRILVPDGMLRAAWHAQLPADNPTFEWDEGDEMSRKFYRRIMEAALRWLSDNPRPMNISLARELDKQYPPSFNRQVLIARSAEEWQRRMFLAPEPVGDRVPAASPEKESAYMRVTKAMGAVTLSEEEGNKILEFVKGSIHAGYQSTESEIPEAVKDLIIGCDKNIDIAALIIEAYRRGKKEGSR
jgi:hypothetical protein